MFVTSFISLVCESYCTSDGQREFGSSSLPGCKANMESWRQTLGDGVPMGPAIQVAGAMGCSSEKSPCPKIHFSRGDQGT